jgi:hypothetical protein
MIRRLLTAILAIPLSLNGLWMECAEAKAHGPAPATAAAQQPAQVAEAKPACQGNVMCPLHKPAQTASSKQASQPEPAITANTQQERTGAICLLSPDGSGTSIAAIGFVYAPPAPVQALELTAKVQLVSKEFVAITYADASLPTATPPPRA